MYAHLQQITQFDFLLHCNIQKTVRRCTLLVNGRVHLLDAFDVSMFNPIPPKCTFAIFHRKIFPVFCSFLFSLEFPQRYLFNVTVCYENESKYNKTIAVIHHNKTRNHMHCMALDSQQEYQKEGNCTVMSAVTSRPHFCHCVSPHLNSIITFI